MELDITDWAAETEFADLSASRAELGMNAAKITWGHAKDAAAAGALLTTDEALASFRTWAKGFGAWSAEEIAAWDATECNALLMQFIAGDMRELESLATGEDGEIDWDEAQRLSQEGTIAGRIYKGDNGRLYFYMGD